MNRSTVLCDTSLSGWYRFSGRAGNQMADSCVDYKHCGTDAPGWMNGGHPSVAERVVSRSVCFRSTSNCCKWSIVISVRNCGGFYVYWLQRPPHCNFRYCGSGIQPTSGTKRELYRLFHVAYREVMAKKSTKKYAARAELLLCLFKLFLFRRSLCRFRNDTINALFSSTKAALLTGLVGIDYIYSLLKRKGLCCFSSYRSPPFFFPSLLFWFLSFSSR